MRLILYVNEPHIPVSFVNRKKKLKTERHPNKDVFGRILMMPRNANFPS